MAREPKTVQLPLRQALRNLLPWAAIGLGVVAFFTNPWVSPGGFGIQGGVSITALEKDRNGSILKRTFKVEQGKSVWDWLSLLGVPFSLAILGFIFQQLQQQKATDDAELQQQKATDDAELQRENADEAAKEEVLQLYYDRLSTPLFEKALLALASTANKTEQDTQLVESASDVFTARTLSVLR